MHLQQIRRRPQPAQHHLLPPLKIRHPHYPHPENLLIAFSRVDIATDQDQKDSDFWFGVHHGTVLTACQIIAGNAIRAYLTYDQLGQTPVQLNYGGILTYENYYLQVPKGIDGGSPYAIIQDFNNWSFPSNGLPQTWNSFRPPSSISETDCLLSNDPDGDNAYFVPLEFASWFERNGMSAYLPDPSEALGPYASSNICRLRSDLLKGFNRGAFVIVPKPTVGGHQLAAHYLSTAKYLSHSVGIFHNQLVHLPHHIPLEYLFAQFAFSMFKLVRGFVTQASRRLAFIVPVVNGRGVESWVTKAPMLFPARPARSLDYNPLSSVTKRPFREVDVDGGDSAMLRHGKRQTMEQVQPDVSSVESHIHRAALRQRQIVVAHGLSPAYRTIEEKRPAEFVNLPLKIRLMIWEATWPKARVIEVKTFSDENSESSDPYEIDDFARLRFNHIILVWL